MVRVSGMLKDARVARRQAGAILQAFSAEVGAERIIGWVREDNRAVLMSRRVGFEIDNGCPRGPVALLGWRP